MFSVSLCIQDASLYIRLVLTHFFFLSQIWDKGEDCATPSKSLWTLWLQYLELHSPKPVYFAIFLKALWQKYWIKCTTYRLCIGNLLYTTEASNVQANLQLFSLLFRSICCSPPAWRKMTIVQGPLYFLLFTPWHTEKANAIFQQLYLNSGQWLLPMHHFS